MRSLLAFSVALATACSSQTSAPSSGSPNGRACVQDTECTSGYCLLQGQGSYCQDKPKVAPACIAADGSCTQNRNCCDGLCQNNACFGTVLPAGSCFEVGSDCAQALDCCSGNCQPAQDGTTLACVPPDRPSEAGACLSGGATCSIPDDCCTGVCTGNVCAGPVTGGGPNCGKSGAYCQYGATCCSQQCVKLGTGTQCR